MKNANRNMTLAAVAALALTVAPSALADVRIRVNLPPPPPPHEVLGHFPAPPLPDVEFRGRFGDADDRYDGRWDYRNRYRDDRWRANEYRRYRYGRYRDRGRWVFVEGRWCERPFPGAVWIRGHYDRYGYWVDGYWARYR